LRNGSWVEPYTGANAPIKVRLIGESRKKDDRLDAQTLARLARIESPLHTRKCWLCYEIRTK
jgi:hypothetical protein